MTISPLLGNADPAPVEILNAQARSQFLLVADHAGNAIPAALNRLGLGSGDLDRHIASDLGSGLLARDLALALDAPLVLQPYSRLVIDCNRAPAHPDSILAVSDGTVIPGNRQVSAEQRQQRIEAIHTPYHAAIRQRLARPGQSPPILVSVHSFTPVLGGTSRPWTIGVLHAGGATGYARHLLAVLRREHGDEIGNNQPYQMDETDYTIPFHAYPAGLDYAELEVRQDLLRGSGRREMASRLARALASARVARDQDAP